MTIVDVLNKKHKVMNCVFEILYDLYGEPVWLRKPKNGQEPEKIIEQWINELGDYSEAQLKQACYNLFKYKKVSTFPKLAHVLAELSDQQKESKVSPAPTVKHGICIEHELMQRDLKAKCYKYFFSDYTRAINYILNDQLKEKLGEREYTILEYSYKDDFIGLRSAKFRKARDLGLFDDIHPVLEKLVGDRR